ncbi:MAG TPA: TlyA family RNA methyltransferase [Candidatus Sulfopaludibacter sp.]|jgi:23S rRNA (cytidine1920-2'-O)/16S rRNA (cytidine1409-2'-O)-methyltransferase|nr:TlyA family RNA methyltransferase [Candidatus Sulfopaludibacter sp.]
MKNRLDRLMVERGLAESREKAQAMIMAGEVRVNGQKAGKPGQSVDVEVLVEVLARPPYVGRGGFKMAGALGHFGIDVTGMVCLDVGSSTGGFTDALLQAGAARVHCVDVGAGQLDWKLRNDARVAVHEGINARDLAFSDIGELCDLLVCDVSFISLTLILPAAVRLLQPGGQMVILIKPQFEVGKGQVGKGGIVRDPALHQAACQRVTQAVTDLGFQTSIMDSPILGAEGNKEFLLHGHH